MFWLTSDTYEHPANEEKYLLHSGICAIPISFSKRELVGVSRAVCRAACSNTFEHNCSSFLYSRRTQTCTLSAYTGEWLPASAADYDPITGLEFYRRIRSSGNSYYLRCIDYVKRNLTGSAVSARQFSIKSIPIFR